MYKCVKDVKIFSLLAEAKTVLKVGDVVKAEVGPGGGMESIDCEVNFYLSDGMFNEYFEKVGE